MRGLSDRLSVLLPCVMCEESSVVNFSLCTPGLYKLKEERESEGGSILLNSDLVQLSDLAGLG